MNGAYADIQKKYPDVVELYFGREVAERAALSMNYPGRDWTGDGTDTVKKPVP